ncbi:type IV toxin-antitoxin system AbiEi family antitoxin [Terriglobus albidus]|uniref:type IV toxin-antitoxin system AbiEi family antitoxin n=1 Tax=Terriglobus albidus TaxID=1592106 RepID=UPI0021E05C53|nr:type IV toxin-antitoxin system AbiEi family antitoxin [Terriglobus albidus]
MNRLNHLLLSLPEGFLADSIWLQDQGLSRSSIRDYVDRGWLERVAPRVYRRPSQSARASLSWEVVVLSLQQIMHKPLHIGARTALGLAGYAHYVEAGETPRVYLYGLDFPSWLTKLPTASQFETRSTRLFGSDTGVEARRYDMRSGEASGSPRDAENKKPWEWALMMSVPERAILEMIDELPHHESFHQVDVMMEGLANLRPQLLGKLLQECTSVKVKRLFLWYADRHRHAWLKRLDQSSVDLGKGKRQLVPHGHFDARYQITLPTELFPVGASNDGQ